MSDNSSPDYKALFHQEAEQEAELRRQAEDRERLEITCNQQTTFKKFLEVCHDCLSQPLVAGTPSRSTKERIPLPTGKYCPTNLCPWLDCSVQQQEIFNAVCSYLQPTGGDAPRLFTPPLELHGLGRWFGRRRLQSEKDLESYERFAVEDHICDIIAELCIIPDAQNRFHLGDGVVFDNHANTLDGPEDDTAVVDESSSQRLQADQFCIHQVNGTAKSLLTTVEYKPPHKLSAENLRTGLRLMEFWKEVVQRPTIPTDQNEKLRYNAEQLTGSALAQEYHIMIQEGLKYSYITTGFALVLLRVLYDNSSTLYYYLCESNMDVHSENPGAFNQPKTAIARVLCLCLMSFLAQTHDQSWRNDARSQLHLWETSFDHARSQIPNEELEQAPPDSEYTSSEHTVSEYLPSSPLQPPPEQRRPTRSQADCMPMDSTLPHGPVNSSDSDSGPAAQSQKQGFSQVMSSPVNQPSAVRPTRSSKPAGDACPQPIDYCTQQCLLGLHEEKVRLLKQQLDHDLDHNCTPFGDCGSYGAPFKITCATYGYTVVGKGTTSWLWKEVSREVEVYQILRSLQGIAIPVFLRAIDLRLVYFLHGAGEIRHMLLMGWGGESLERAEKSPTLTHEIRHEIHQSTRQIRKLGVMHNDLRRGNLLWNPELRWVLVIDFHKSNADCRPTGKRIKSLKELPNQTKRRRLLSGVASLG
ncbi:hypothetical protein RJ035_005769 [Blastomyces gilchristii]